MTMYVDNFCGLEKECFNFDIKSRFVVSGAGDLSIRKVSDGLDGFPDDFFGENISALTLLIGENGSGKTTLLRLLIKWLCQLSHGKIPEEKGALIIRVDNVAYAIAFERGKILKPDVPSGIKKVENTDEVIPLLNDITLLYYTDTMTDLELENLLTDEERAFLTDHSLLTRIASAIKGAQIQHDPKSLIKRAEFSQQMEQYLKMENPAEYPIHYMQLIASRPGRSPFWAQTVQQFDEREELTELMSEFGKRTFGEDDKNWTLPSVLVWGLLTGILGSLLLWESRELLGKEARLREHILEALHYFLRINPSDSSVYRLNLDILRNIVDFVGADGSEHIKKLFFERWESFICKTCCEYLNELEKMDGGRPRERASFWQQWASENGVGDRLVWHIPLSELPLDEWRDFWGKYHRILTEMPDCELNWRYNSSAEKNRSNLLINIYNQESYKNNVWMLLDEPDNTYHPDWKRRIIHLLCERLNHMEDRHYQLWITTHSPIMLSDVPKPAAILLMPEKTGGKMQRKSKSSPFGQQIYTLFNDSFFLKDGAIGAFAEEKIRGAYQSLIDLKKKTNACDAETLLSELERIAVIVNAIDEPLLSGYLNERVKECREEIKKGDPERKNIPQ